MGNLYISEICYETLSVEFEYESGGRFWVTYDTIEDMDAALELYKN
jgi:hypothetical protein